MRYPTGAEKGPFDPNNVLIPGTWVRLTDPVRLVDLLPRGSFNFERGLALVKDFEGSLWVVKRIGENGYYEIGPGNTVTEKKITHLWSLEKTKASTDEIRIVGSLARDRVDVPGRRICLENKRRRERCLMRPL